MATDNWHPKRGDQVLIRATGEEVTAMKFDGRRIRVHHHAAATGPAPAGINSVPSTPVRRISLRPPEWFDLSELKPAQE